MPSHSTNKKPQPGAATSKVILIGEDDIDDQEFLKEIFVSIDDSFEFLFASNAPQIFKELEECAGKHLPCLILLDYNMPGLNGAEILRELKNNPKYASIPKIIWSTSRSDTYKEICLALGANDYLVKPSSVTDLVEVCKYMLSVCSVS